MKQWRSEGSRWSVGLPFLLSGCLRVVTHLLFMQDVSLTHVAACWEKVRKIDLRAEKSNRRNNYTSCEVAQHLQMASKNLWWKQLMNRRTALTEDWTVWNISHCERKQNRTKIKLFSLKCKVHFPFEWQTQSSVSKGLLAQSSTKTSVLAESQFFLWPDRLILIRMWRGAQGPCGLRTPGSRVTRQARSPFGQKAYD